TAPATVTPAPDPTAAGSPVPPADLASRPVVPAVDVEQGATPQVPAETDDELTGAVVGIVADLTGYPPELLEVDLDLEADLGVDTVKQAEVFAAVRERFHIPRDETLKLRDFPTLTHVIAWIHNHTKTAT